MNIKHYLKTLIVLGTLTLPLSSCGGDSSAPSIDPSTQTYLVQTIWHESPEGKISYTFSYDEQERLTGISRHNSKDSETYRLLKISYPTPHEIRDSVTPDLEIVMTLNKDGVIEKETSYVDGKELRHTLYEYKNGFLQNTQSYISGKEENRSRTDFEWSPRPPYNMVKIIDVDHTTSEYTYSSIPNKIYPDILSLLPRFKSRANDLLDDVLGQRNATLPFELHEKSYGNTTTLEAHYSYTLNENGVPNTINVTSREKKTDEGYTVKEDRFQISYQSAPMKRKLASENK